MAGRKGKTIDGMRPCRTCGGVFPVSSFHTYKRGGHHSDCKACSGRLSAESRKRNFKKHSSVSAVRHAMSYGLTKEEALRVVENREGKCPICGIVRRLVIDHDHRSGLVRGVICGKCNSVLGMANDCIQTLLSAAEYLRKTS